jgi:hypothetical protein
VIFRAPVTRAARATLCALLIAFLGWAIHAEIVFGGIDGVLRAVALTPTVALEVALVVGLWRLWVVCLIVNETGVIVRNFRGDIRLKRNEIREVFASLNATGCHVGLRLKIGDEIHLEGLAFATPTRTERAVQEISQALGLVSPPDEP